MSKITFLGRPMRHRTKSDKAIMANLNSFAIANKTKKTATSKHCFSILNIYIHTYILISYNIYRSQTDC